MRRRLARIWEKWVQVAHWIGEKQAVAVFTLLYFSVVALVALIMRPFSDPFRYRTRNRDTFWISRTPAEASLEEARRQ